MQYFKGDAAELLFAEAGRPQTEIISAQRSEFYDGAETCFKLGEVLWDSNRAPLARAIPRDIFREAFASIFDSFLVAGSFESYLEVFRNIFGEDVEVTFTVPGPGKLEIDIVAAGLAIYGFSVRQIVGDSVIIDTIVDDEGDRIVFQSVKGFESQYELEQMLFEMVPGGIFTSITLTVG